MEQTKNETKIENKTESKPENKTAPGNDKPKKERKPLTEAYLLYTSPSPRDRSVSRMPSSA